jgi:hypothetical protein
MVYSGSFDASRVAAVMVNYACVHDVMYQSGEPPVLAIIGVTLIIVDVSNDFNV